jgi:hypothetical protein
MANEAQKKFLDSVRKNKTGTEEIDSVQDISEGSGLGRTFAQGLSLGTSDEIEAGLRSLLGKVGITDEDRDYKEIRDKLRSELKQYKKQNPGTAVTAELVGAIVPSVIQTLLSGGLAAPMTIARLAKLGAVEGSIAGYGLSESETLGGQASDVLASSIFGAGVSPAIGYGGKYVAQGFSNLIDFTRQKFGNLSADSVQAEVRRLQELTGKNPDQIIQDLSEGRLMSDNTTLQNALKGYVIAGGEAGKSVLDRTGARATDTKKYAMQQLENRLSPGMGENVIKDFKETEKTLLKRESDAYDQIFASTPDSSVTRGIAQDMLQAARTIPNAMDEINNIYKMQKLVPLFVKDKNGAIEMVRQPSLKDAEIIRRAIKETTTKMYKSGDTTAAGIVSDLEQSLRTQIDNLSAPLKQTRARYAEIKNSSDAFKAGRMALTANVDETEMLVERLKNNPAQLKAFRAGVMDSIRNKSRRTGTIFANLSDPENQIGAALRVALNGDDAALENALKIAGDAAQIAKGVKPGAGSPTAQLQRELKNQGTDISGEDAIGAIAGNPISMMRVFAKRLKQEKPMMNESERQQVVDTIFSKDPDLLKKALTDRATFDFLTNKYSGVGEVVGSTARKFATFQQSQPGTGILNFGQ